MTKMLRLASWNIAGGRLVKSLAVGKFDYEQNENLNYFADTLHSLSPNIVCLQEAHTKDASSQANVLAEKLNLKHVFSSASHPSHIDKNCSMGTTILSSLPSIKTFQFDLPYPDWPLFWPSGKPVEKFNKVIQLVSFKNFYVANVHLHPIGLWNADYNQNPGLAYARQIEKVFLKLTQPLILCGDFSGDFARDNPKAVLSEFFRKFNLSDSLPDRSTRPLGSKNGRRTDHIYRTQEFKVVSSKIIPTKTDHFLCFTELSL